MESAGLEKWDLFNMQHCMGSIHGWCKTIGIQDDNAKLEIILAWLCTKPLVHDITQVENAFQDISLTK